jgi:hypothetical protein
LRKHYNIDPDDQLAVEQLVKTKKDERAIRQAELKAFKLDIDYSKVRPSGKLLKKAEEDIIREKDLSVAARSERRLKAIKAESMNAVSVIDNIYPSGSHQFINLDAKSKKKHRMELLIDEQDLRFIGEGKLYYFILRYIISFIYVPGFIILGIPRLIKSISSVLDTFSIKISHFP